MYPDDPASSSTGEQQEPDQPMPVVVATTDPAIARGRSGEGNPEIAPDQTVVAETSRVTQAAPVAVLPGSPTVEMKPALSAEKSRDEKKQPNSDDPKKEENKSHKERPAWMGLAMTAVVALVCGVAGAAIFSAFGSSKDKNEDSSKQAKKGGDSSGKGSDSKDKPDQQAAGSPEEESPKAMASPDAKATRDQIQQLYSRFATIQQRVDELATPRVTNSPDLAALRARVDQLSGKLDEVGRFPGLARNMEDRLDRLQSEMKGLHGQLAIDKNPGAARTEPKAEPTNAPISPTTDHSASTDPMMDEGISLFKKGLYTRADEVFRKLQGSKPKDARVWYFSALAHGMATGQWDGETRLFVVQGADRERAGLPPAPEIDSAFAGLSAAQGKDWLASYRSQLVKR